jgi:hypothetical protein
MTDKRRFGVIEVQQVNAITYHLKIGGVMWAEVEWSGSRKAWCIQDCCGQCLMHVASIVGQDVDMQKAIRLAKRMIVDGRMPTPEEARAAHDRRRLAEGPVGEPFSIDPEPLGVPVKRG